MENLPHFEEEKGMSDNLRGLPYFVMTSDENLISTFISKG